MKRKSGKQAIALRPETSKRRQQRNSGLPAPLSHTEFLRRYWKEYKGNPLFPIKTQKWIPLFFCSFFVYRRNEKTALAENTPFPMVEQVNYPCRRNAKRLFTKKVCYCLSKKALVFIRAGYASIEWVDLLVSYGFARAAGPEGVAKAIKSWKLASRKHDEEHHFQYKAVAEAPLFRFSRVDNKGVCGRVPSSHRDECASLTESPYLS